jgi:STE24 endopeptidase
VTTSLAARPDLAGRYFSKEEIDRARAYHRPLYLSFAISTVLSLGYLGALAFSPLGRWLADPVGGLPRWAFALSYTGLVVAIGSILRLPLSVWRGYVYEHRWGFSTQSFTAWLADWGKGLAVQLVLTGSVFLGFVELVAATHGRWPLAVAPAAVALVVFLSFIAPVVLEPIFNRFKPLEDRELAAELHAVADHAGTPVKEILVADASRRTKKENAYVSGLGKTRRVVLYDTLLGRGSARDIRLVVAHELGHRRDRHVAWGTVFGAGGAIAGVVILWGLLRWHAVLAAITASGPSAPRAIPFVLFAISALELLALPFETAVSRRWERAADRASIELTGDVEGFAEMERGLAVANLSDLDPPRPIYLLLFTHPSPPERIQAAIGSEAPTTT